MMKISSLPDLTDEKTWTKLIKEEEIRFDSITMRESGVKAIRDRLTQMKKKASWMNGNNILAEDIVELSYVTYQAELFTHRVTESLTMKSRLVDYQIKMIRAAKRLTYQINETLQLMMFYSYLNPVEEIILSHLFKRIKYVIQKQRVWDPITEEDDTFQKQKQMVPAVEIRQAKGFYFSDLPEEVLTILFGKGPLFRFELCTVVLMYGIFSKQPMLYGIIRAAESPVGQDGFLEVFNRKDNDPLLIPAYRLGYLRDCIFSLPVSNPVQFHLKLHIKVETYDDDSYNDDEDAYHNELLTTDNDEDDDAALERDIKVVAEQMKAALEKYPAVEVEVEDEDPVLSDLIDQDFRLNQALIDDFLRREEELKMKDIGEPFEVYNDYIHISDYLAKRHNGCCGSYRTKGKDASLELCYVVLKNTVDAALEVEFFGKETKVVARVYTYYGRGFDYGFRAEKHLYSLSLFERESNNPFVIKPGKVNLTRSVLPVPAQFSLLVYVYFRDFNTWDVMLEDTYEFLVPCDGSSSVGSIVGKDCSLNIKVDWKLPFGHMLSI